MKKLLKTLNIFFIFLFCFTCNSLTAYADGPNINAQGYALIDATTGQLLYGKNEDAYFEPASTTKVMTAIVVLEHCSLNEKVTITQNFTEIDGTAIGLLKGDEITVKDLLLGLLLESGNDCANALAIHVSGSIPEFAKLMNEKAKLIGATDINFQNPSGLPDTNHVLSPKSLALIMREAINNKYFMDISTTPYATITMLNNSSRTIIVNNKNYMINKNSKYYYPYAISGKNGYTIKANHTYVAAAQKDGHILVASFLNATDKNQNFFDMQTIFNSGFNNFSFVKLYSKGDKITDYNVTKSLTVPLIATKDIGYVVPKGQENSVSGELKIENKDLAKESFNKGDPILKGTVLVDGQELETLDLVAGESRLYEPPFSKASLSDKSNTPLYVCLGIGALALCTGIGLFIKMKLKN
ncbi:MAG: D-alanyl-D-alanine carboxypeptidase [Clostridium butyricum]|nr:D-alanyl-D-alanine carboxypeptidase [Clostridium butyricum]